MASLPLIGRLGSGINEHGDLFGGGVEGQQSRKSAQVHGARLAARQRAGQNTNSEGPPRRTRGTERRIASRTEIGRNLITKHSDALLTV